MKFETTRFGIIDVTKDDVFTFPEGPLGFPEFTRFVFIDEEKTRPFLFLQSLDNPNFSFVIVDPMFVRPTYHFNATKKDLAPLGTDSTDDLQVWAIVAMAAEVEDITVNLQGPLIINKANQIGHQFVLVDSTYTVREPFMIRKK